MVKYLAAMAIGLLLSTQIWGAQLARFKGDVQVNDKAAVLNQEIKTGDRISAKGVESFFVVRYEDGSKFLLRNGELVVGELKKDESQYQLLNGLFYAFVNPKNKPKFTVKTKTASMGVRGTKFWLRETANESYLCVCEGKVQVTRGADAVMVSRNEDLHLKSVGKFPKKAHASKRMLDMAQNGLKELDAP